MVKHFNLDVTSKYAVEQVVFYMRHNQIESGEIRAIRMEEIKMDFQGRVDEPKFVYSLKDKGDFSERFLYASKEALVRSL